MRERSMRRAAGCLRAGAVAAAAVLAFAPQAKAQQPATPGTSKTQPKSAGKPEPAQAAPQPPAPGAPIFLFSPWAKICGKDGPEGSDAKQVCAVISEARVEGGQIAATAALVEPADQSQNILRVTLPLGVRLPYGTRIIVDQGTPLQSGYIMCLVGCISDYQVGPDLMEKLRKGRQLTLQAINPGGAPISVDVPLEGFAKAVDGPATDEKVVASQQKKLEEQLKARAEETRKRLETTGGAGVPFATAPGTK